MHICMHASTGVIERESWICIMNDRVITLDSNEGIGMQIRVMSVSCLLDSQ